MGQGSPRLPRQVPVICKRPGEGGSGQMSLKKGRESSQASGGKGRQSGAGTLTQGHVPALSRGCPGELQERKLKQFLELSGPGERQWRAWGSAQAPQA